MTLCWSLERGLRGGTPGAPCLGSVTSVMRWRQKTRQTTARRAPRIALLLLLWKKSGFCYLHVILFPKQKHRSLRSTYDRSPEPKGKVKGAVSKTCRIWECRRGVAGAAAGLVAARAVIVPEEGCSPCGLGPPRAGQSLPQPGAQSRVCAYTPHHGTYWGPVTCACLHTPSRHLPGPGHVCVLTHPITALTGARSCVYAYTPHHSTCWGRALSVF